ncbi:MAG: peptide MFS transporter [Phycisphaerales bacterium]
MSDHREEDRFAGADPELGEEAVRGLSGGPGAPTREGHPPGLWVLFITEMWERFSYYGMRALFVLYLTASTAPFVEENVKNANPGFGWSDADAYTLYGVYTFMVYLTSIFGGIAADRLLGTHRSMLIGGWVIALGHITLALGEFFKIEPNSVVSMSTGAGSLLTFLLGCTFIIIGTGFFKPCVSVMVGQMYGENDPRRDSGFTIFYMGINLGAFFSPLVAGWLGEKVGWHWGFGSAAVGMIVGLIFYQLFRGRYLGKIGAPPEEPLTGNTKALVTTAMIGLLAIPTIPLILYATNNLGPIEDAWSWTTGKLGSIGTPIAFTLMLLVVIAAFLAMQKPGERSRLGVIFILAFFGNIFFWSAFEQAGSSLNIFAADSTDRTLFGLFKDGFPASWYQSVNPLSILIFAPIFSWLWVFLDRKRANPSTPMKFAIGLWLLGLAFLAMVFGSLQARDGGKAGPHWLLISYVVMTWGELCLSPVGLSMVTKLSPKRLQSLMMGLWFFSLALSNLSAGLVARLSTEFLPGENGEAAKRTFIMEGLPGFFLMLVIFPIAAGLVVAVLTPVLRKMMRGIH